MVPRSEGRRPLPRTTEFPVVAPSQVRGSDLGDGAPGGPPSIVLDAGFAARIGTRAGAAVRAAPLGADRLCYRMLARRSRQRTRFRRRSSGRGAASTDSRSGGAALVAVPHRHERLPRHAQRPRAAGAADGPRAGAGAGSGELHILPEVTWVEPIPDGRAPTIRREARNGPAGVRRRAAASAAAPARRADPLRGAALEATETAELLETSVAGGEQRASARACNARVGARAEDRRELDAADRELLDRYVDAFQAYDIDALTALIREDATQSMPPYELWLAAATTSSAGGSAPASAAGARGSCLRARERPSGVRPVQAEPGRRPCAVGTEGASARRGPYRRDDVLPRHRDAVPAVRAALAAAQLAAGRPPARRTP